MKEKLIIDPEFQKKIPPLTEDEFSLLEENIVSDGAVLSPIIVWNDIILDGHNRYEIIQKHPEISYTVHEMQFENRYEALSWMCKNQLGRRNLTSQQKKYLIGQRYEAEKMAHGGDRRSPEAKSTVQNEQLKPKNAAVTRQHIAKDTNTSESYVMRAGWYAQGIDAAEEALPGIKQDILTGAIKPTETAVAAIAKAAPEEREELTAALKKPKDRTKQEPDKPQPVYHKTPISERRSTMAQIAEISAEMERPKPPATEEDILATLDAEVDSFTEACVNLFQEYPKLISEEHYRNEVVRIMGRITKYIAKIEGGKTK